MDTQTNNPVQLSHGFFGHLRVSLVATVLLAIIVCGIYPVIVLFISQVLFSSKANGSLIGKDGSSVSKDEDAVGSSLIGQSWSDPKYFHPRISAAGNGYDATASGGSNLGPTSAKLMFGTTKDFAYTIFAADKSHTAVGTVSGRVQGVVTDATKTAISVAPQGTPAGSKTTYALDPSVADPNTVVNYHGRTIHSTTIPVGAIVELKLNDKTPPAVIAINVVDQEIDAGITFIDTGANKITLNDAGGTTLNVDPKSTVFVVNGKSDGKLEGLTTDMALHAVVALQMDYDGIADRVIHYCQDNKIDYKSSVLDSAFTDADGVDDEKLVAAFNAASPATIDASKPVPADAVTASGSGLDPHISVDNATIQAARVASTRKIDLRRVNDLIGQCTDKPSLGIFGDAGVNVLRLNIALDNLK
jgi:K+-transporting ATPase KdpC subunit